VVAGRFELQRIIGRGGMSEVWLARDRELERPVVLKLCAPHAEPARFEREARSAAELSHGNVVRVFDFGWLDDRPYMVLEYLPGGTLEGRLRAQEPLPDDETERIAHDVAAGLAQAHAAGVVHRDLKPSNVLFDEEGRAKLADFGIARAWGDATLTDPGTLLGTAHYMAPEQAAGKPPGPAGDVYSFGVLLFQMLTGRLPLPAEGPVQATIRHRDEPAPPVRSVRPEAPAVLAELADRPLAKDPRARPADGAALLAALAETAPPEPGIPSETAETNALEVPVQRRRGGRRQAALVALAALAAAGGAAGLLVGGEEAPSVTTAQTGNAATARTDAPTETEAQSTPAGPPPAPSPAPSGTNSTTSAPTTTEPSTSTEPATTTDVGTTTAPTTTSSDTGTGPGSTTTADTTSAPPTTSATTTAGR
jgi:eukaryotic-like serine/threonine-protein kinase